MSKSYKKIKEIYDNSTYFDLYGGSVILFILITIIFVILLAYFFILLNIQPIKDNWITEKCKPYVIPFAGLINKPPEESITKFTYDNFYSCSQDLLTSITGFNIEPLTFIN